MSDSGINTVRGLLLTRSGVLLLAEDSRDRGSGGELARAAELEFAAVGVVVSDRLHARLATCSAQGLADMLA